MAIQQMFLGAGGAVPFEMSGGNNSGAGYEYTFGGTTYRVHTFLSNGTLTVTGEGEYEALLVGGGGGGHYNGGGGGGGGVIYVGGGAGGAKTISAGTYNVVIGQGGDTEGNYNYPQVPSVDATNDGGSSTFDGYTATGGGSGSGGLHGGVAARAGANGGGMADYSTTSVTGTAPALPSGDTHGASYGGYTGGQWVNTGNYYISGAGAGAGGNASTTTDATY